MIKGGLIKQVYGTVIGNIGPLLPIADEFVFTKIHLSYCLSNNNIIDSIYLFIRSNGTCNNSGHMYEFQM